ncbi:MAG: MBL fold metallo-hydrolase [Defluviitaleaceae bacterium]|nr:MBL fold metallo-hydrolase [Defluviitaleaceae bacterium]
MTITIYGSRGSIPYYHKDNIRLGMNTSCTRLDVDGRIIMLDAGTGLVGFSPPPDTSVDILLGHLHLDHISGLSAFPELYQPCDIRIHTKSRASTPLAEQVLGVFKPPYWPVPLSQMCKAEFMEINGEFMIGGTRVIPFAANHADDTTAFRLEGEKTLVYLLDYEVIENTDDFDRLVDYCRNADAVIFDAAYLPEDYLAKRGWGHSTYETGFALAERCGCKRMIFSHFDYRYTDDVYNILAKKVDNEKFLLAYDGMSVTL